MVTFIILIMVHPFLNMYLNFISIWVSTCFEKLIGMFIGNEIIIESMNQDVWAHHLLDLLQIIEPLFHKDGSN